MTGRRFLRAGGALVRRLGLALLLAAAIMPACAADTPASAPDLWSRLSGPEFDHFPPSLRLPSDVVTSLAQTRPGVVWFGTFGGLVRFDGYRTQIYRGATDTSAATGAPAGKPGAAVPPPSHVLPDAYVRSLLSVDGGGLLIGTNAGGLVRFDMDAYGFRPVPITHGDVATRIMAMGPARDGGAWVVSDQGLDHYDPHTATASAVADAGAGGVSPRLFTVLEDSRGALWLGGHPGLFRRGAGEAAFTRVVAPADDPALARALADDIWALYEDGGGRVWVGTGENGAFVLDAVAGRPLAVKGISGVDSLAARHTVRAIIEPEGPGGPLWLATDGVGILTLDAGGQVGALAHSEMVSTSLAGDVVRAFLRDRSGNVWVGTQRGADRVEAGQRLVSTVQAAPPGGVGLADADVHALTTDARGRVWLALGRGLIDVVDPADGILRHVVLPGVDQGRDIYSLAVLPDGAVLAGGRGVTRVDPVTLASTSSWIPALDGIVVLSLATATTPAGTAILLGGYDGLYIRQPDGTLAHLVHDAADAESLPADQVNKVLVLPPSADAPQGTLWLATSGGLAVASLGDLPRLRFHTLRRGPQAGAVGSLPHNVVNDVVLDGAGNLWAGTYGGGVAVLAPAQMRDALAGRVGITPLVVDETQGLADNAVSALAVDGDGSVWAAAASLVKFNGLGFPPRVLGARDGVIVRSFNIKAAGRGAGGEVLFGGVGGLTVMRPGMLGPAVPVGLLAVTALDVNHKAQPPGRLPQPGGTLTLGAGVKTIRLALSLLDFRAPHDTRYAYRLDGFDEDWVEVNGAQPQAVYTNLPQGDYTFRVRAWTDLPGLALTNRQEATAGFDPDAEPVAQPGQNTAEALSIAPMAELAFHLKVLPHWYEQAWFRLLMVFGLVALMACALAVRTEAQMRRERALGRIVAARTRDLRAANTKLEQLASTDPLTGILNRRRFFELARLECDRSRRYGRTFSVILFDLDHFKRINDTFGHLMGDEVLRAAVTVAGKACRAVDLLARFGGEEVMLLLPETDIAGAQVVAERIRTSLAELEVAYDGQVAQVTASLGVAQWRSPDETLEDLLARADGALYQAKKGGRNRTVLAYNEVERAARMGWAIVPSGDAAGDDGAATLVADTPPLEPLARLAGLGDTTLMDPYERETYDRPQPGADEGTPPGPKAASS
ncbi:diguanylate cyclase [Nitrospirillum sp. BR 11163]|uniref:diguanylate cyclase n=1 Tax=Nitrospirillum sp. BR 11163 TaxID=3104323 RepID=UPI002AFEBE7F|nr:diguanylate cyclase [Nitrospirillum sp. BR 11163]MEA1674357.1 diguanylate cyclase [Nitrospirillum sp. BR 11163]